MQRKLTPGAWVALGGGLGAAARFILGGGAMTWAPATFPWGTLLVNTSGSVILGFVYGMLEGTAPSRDSRTPAFSARTNVPRPPSFPHARAFLAVGMCGGFTTFSAFSQETLELLRQTRYMAASFYTGGSVLLCIIGVGVGIMTAEAWQSHQTRPQR
ncbi:MAG: CrcB family protein [Gemmatimonadetes bacterium]|nr:CrcB family protein [Gemmatimonadota bacterium]